MRKVVVRWHLQEYFLSFDENLQLYAPLTRGGIHFGGDLNTQTPQTSCVYADLTPIPSCAARINLLLWCFIPHHLFKPMEATFSRSRKSLIKRDSTCCLEGGGRPADSSRLALPPAIKRNVSINPEKRPRTRATKFIVRVEKTTLVVSVFVSQMGPVAFQGPGLKQK